MLKVLIFPWLAHGHIFPFLELSKKLSHTKTFHIHFCSTSINLDSVRKHLDEDDTSIELVELRLPPHPDLPPNFHTTKNIPPHLMQTLMRSFQMSTLVFTDIIETLKPDLLIYDGFQPWSAKIAASLGIPSVLFVTSSSTATSFFLHAQTHSSLDTFPRPEIFLRAHEKRSLVSHGESIVEANDEGFFSGMFDSSNEIVLIKSFRGMEGKCMDYLSELCGKRIVPTGPLITPGPDTFPRPEIFLRAHEKRSLVSHGESIVEANDEGFFSEMFDLSNEVILIKSFRGMEGKCMDYLSELCGKRIVPTGPLITPGPDTSEISRWLDRKRPCSTLYISFGSENYLSEREMIEVAKGLKMTRVDFVWVVRSASMDEGFVESVERSGKGMFLREWAPQSEILAHRSVGGFMSHCGWSSVMEGVYFGVPILGVPLKVDQPVNCRVVVEAGVGVGVEAMRGAGGEFDGGEIAKAIDEVFGPNGERLKVRVEYFRKAMKAEEEEGFIHVKDELVRVCAKNKKN